jgi:hypothetical protein
MEMYLDLVRSSFQISRYCPFKEDEMVLEELRPWRIILENIGKQQNCKTENKNRKNTRIFAVKLQKKDLKVPSGQIGSA